MAFGQIDPARLDGEELKQWYLRSPADIEAERQQAADRAHDAFFFAPGDRRSDDGQEAASSRAASSEDLASNDEALVWREIGRNRFRSERAPDLAMSSSNAGLSGLQPGAATFPSWGRWPINGCFACHNTQTGDLLPGRSPAPLPPTSSPRDGSGSGGGGGGGASSARRGEWSDKPHCDQQFEMDREVCQQAHHPQCWINQLRRLNHCERTDEVNEPGLGFGPRGRR
jgi:hypothetical protein